MYTIYAYDDTWVFNNPHMPIYTDNTTVAKMRTFYEYVISMGLTNRRVGVAGCVLKTLCAISVWDRTSGGSPVE